MVNWQGLTDKQAEESRERFGMNVLEKVRNFSIPKLLFEQFSSPLMVVLIVAGLISYFLHGVVDAIVVWMAVVLNGLLGFYQEYRAERALEALEKQVQVEAEVLRGGKRIKLAVAELAVGDVVYLTAGDKIPADGSVLQAESFAVSEAMLTGESVPVEKTAAGEDKVYMGTVVMTGIAVIKIMKVGRETEMGKIAASLASTQKVETVLQQKMAQFAKILTYVIVAVATLLFIVGWFKGLPIREIFLVAVAVAVSAIPEGLVVALTVILVLGMQRLLKRKGLVRKLLAAEALGSVTVVCSDKTGTLTLGEMQVAGSEGEEPALAEMALLCNDLSDPMEMAMQEWGGRLCEVSVAGCRIDEWERVATLPFSSELKYAATKHTYNNTQRLIVRGAPEVVLDLCVMSSSEKKSWHKKFVEMAARGYRLVALAERQDSEREEVNHLREKVKQGGFGFAGLIVLEDPVRENVQQEIAKLEPAGIKFKVVTGDYAATAAYVMNRLGVEVGDKMITGDEFSQLSTKKQRKAARDYVLFARFSPGEKLALVKALQYEGEVVAMMGDGVNDAPALKTADVGIVVSTATEVSKETADMVLLDDQFGTVIAGIEEGRGIYVRIKRVVSYLLSDSFSEVVLVSVSLFLGLPLPVTAAQILWVNLANDTFPALALSADPVDQKVMSRGPISRETPIVDGKIKWLIGAVSAVSGLIVLGLFWLYLQAGYAETYARTVAFFFLGINTLLTVFVIRKMDEPIWRSSIFENGWLWLGVGVGVVMQFAAVYWKVLRDLFGTEALVMRDVGVVFAGSLVMILLIEVLKIPMRRAND